MKGTLEGELYHEIELLGDKKYAHIGFRDKEKTFGDLLESLVPEVGMTRKARITIEVLDEESE